MTDKPSQSKSEIESKLSQWGAAKAVDNAQQALPPMSKPQRHRIGFRRSPLALAASVMLLLMGGLVIHQLNQATLSTSIPDTVSAPTLPQRSEPRNSEPSDGFFENQLAEQQQRIIQLELTAGQLPSAKQVQELARTLTQTLDQLKTLKKQVQTQQVVVTDQNNQLRRILTSQQQTQTTQSNFAKQVTDLKHQVASQNDQMQSVTALVQTMTQQLASLQTREVQYVTDLQAIYLASAAPGQHGWASRQAAAREHRMLARLNAFYKQADDPTLHQLLEKLEVTLTYLELMDADNPKAVKHLDQMIDNTQIASTIDQLLDSSLSHTTLRTWLLEVRLILAGVSHAS